MAEENANKCCARCKAKKPICEFHKRAAASDGHSYWCKSCTQAADKKTYEVTASSRKQTMREWGVRNGEKHRSKAKEWYEKNHDKALQAQSIYRHANREKLREEARHKRTAPAARAANAERAKKWARANPEKRSAQSAHRKASNIQATPCWVDREAIAAVYRGAQRLSASLGVSFHVDHVVPLRSSLVCGLHVPANLQVLRDDVNMAKGNRWWPDMPT